jgi:hypothetical protein
VRATGPLAGTTTSTIDAPAPHVAWLVGAAVVLLVAAVDAIVVPGILSPKPGVPYDAGRPDYFYMADAFLHGRLWLDVPWPQPIADTVVVGGRVYVPFQPFPGLLLMPLVAVLGLTASIDLEPLVNAVLSGITVALAWTLLGRLGVRRWTDRLLLVALFGFGTVIWNITIRGGVWHTAEIVGTGLTLWALCETRAERPRPWLLGLLGGAAFFTRSTLLFALPYYAWVAAGRPAGVDALRSAVRTSPGALAMLVAGFVPFVVGTGYYNWARFGSPFETGYGLVALPGFLTALRAQGLFSLVHLNMNLDYLFLRGPRLEGSVFEWKPDTLGMAVTYSSPALVVGVRSLWGRLPETVEARALALAGALVLAPTLLYYGGGWLQFGYRYLLDSIPFWLALCGLWAARRGVGPIWKAAIAWSVGVNAWLVYWTFRL